MKALKCDICGSFYDYDRSEISGFAFLNVAGSLVGNHVVDICPNCRAAIQKVLGDRKKVRIENARTENE